MTHSEYDLPPQPARAAHGSPGFTLIELMMVVVILGILAVIAIPLLGNQREKAYDVAAKADLRNAMAAQEAYFADQQSYADVSAPSGTEDAATGFVPSIAVSVSGSGDEAGYIMTAKHGSSPNTYCVNSTNGIIGLGTSC